MAEVWFIRHGESTGNVGEITWDTASIPLTARGREQARRLALPKAPDLIVVTPYLRTQQTAAPSIARFPSARVETWPLQEFSCLSHAAYGGMTQAQRAPSVRAYWDRQDPLYVDGPGAESFSAMTARIRDGFSRLQAAPEDFIAVFTHGRIMQTLRFLLARPDMPERDLMRAIPAYCAHTEIENCAVIRATAGPAGIALHEEDRRSFEAGFKPAAPVPRRPARFSP